METTTDRVRASRRTRGIEAIRAALSARGADAFVHVASDADATYLGADAVVVTPDAAVALHRGDAWKSKNAWAEGQASADVTARVVDDPVSAVANVVADRTSGKVVLSPRAIRHDAALFLDGAGFDLSSTTAVSDARAVKTEEERTALREAGSGVAAAFDAVGERLAGARVEDGVCVVGRDETEGRRDTANQRDGDTALTTEALSRDLRVALARHGLEFGESTVWSVGEAVHAGRPVVVDCRPVTPDGTHLRAAWTFVVDGDGGWERRADLALDAAHRAGRQQLASAVEEESETAGRVASEVRAELTAYGFEETTVSVHGVGCEPVERPQGGDDIESGQVVVVAAQVTRADDETVSSDRRTDVVRRVETLVLDDGVERLVSLPSSLSPARR